VLPHLVEALAHGAAYGRPPHLSAAARQGRGGAGRAGLPAFV